MVAGVNDATFQDSGKYAFLEHDAVTCLVIDGAAAVALFTDLGDFKQAVVDLQL